MNKTIGEKANDYFLMIIEWLPLLIVLQLLWFVSSLPLLTIGSASRTVIHTIYFYRQKRETRISSLFWKEFRYNLATYSKRDMLSSLYFLLLIIDRSIFAHWGGELGYVLMSASWVLLYLSAIVFIYRTMVQLDSQKVISRVTALFLFFHHWQRALLHLLGTLVILLFFLIVGPIYLLLVGISSLLYFQTLLYFDQYKNSESKV